MLGFKVVFTVSAFVGNPVFNDLRKIIFSSIDLNLTSFLYIAILINFNAFTGLKSKTNHE